MDSIEQQQLEIALQHEQYWRHAPSHYVHGYLTGNLTERSVQSISHYRTYRPVRRRNDPRQSVDELIGDGRLMIPLGDSVTAMLTDRLHADWLNVDDTILQIQQRHSIYEQNVRELEQSRLSALNLMHSFPKFLERVSPGDYQVVRRMLDDIDGQHRQERIQFWRDVSRLRQTLPTMVKDYLAGYRKIQLFGSDAA